MKKISLATVLLSACAFLVFASCGGGGDAPAPAPSNTAILTLSSSGTLPANTQIGGIDLTITLPSGSAVKAKSVSKGVLATYSGGIVASGVAAGANTIVLASSPAESQLSVKLANAIGFGTGEFAQVTCDLVVGSSVTEADFTNPTSFVVVDLNGIPIPGLTGSLTAVVQ